MNEDLKTRSFSLEEKKNEAYFRVANALFSFWRVTNFEEKEKLNCASHSRLFEVLISDEFVTIGKSQSDANCREHVVPVSLIRNHAFNMFKKGYLIEDISKMIEQNLYIILLSKDERELLDKPIIKGGKGWKTTMPDGWKFGDDPFDRLNQAGIEFTINK